MTARSDGRRFRAIRIETASPSHVVPPCPLAPSCGGCTLQHWHPTASLAWKAGRVEGALGKAGYEAVPMRPSFQVKERTRRRMTVAFGRLPDGRARVGLRRRLSHEIVDMTECLVLHPALFALLAPFRTLVTASALIEAGETGSLTVNLLNSGPDLLLRTPRALTSTARSALAGFASRHGVSRVSWRGDEHGQAEPIAVLRRPVILFGDRTVEPAPGAFLQAEAAAEQLIVADVVSAATALGRRSTIVELYAGNGTLTFPLSTIGRVRAYEGDQRAFEALARASGGTRVTVILRDLARAPVSSGEFRDASMVVLDPPHGGAGPQIDELAAARVPAIVLVSCNPGALAREAATLNRAGYALEGTRAIDQFLFSARVESVSIFRRRP